MRNGSTKALVATLFLACVTPQSIAMAAGVVPTEQDKQRAVADVREGNRLLDEGKPEEALARFRQARVLVGGDKLYYNIGQALKSIPGREVKAYAAFAQFIRNVPGASPEMRKSAKAQQLEIQPKVGLLALKVAPASAVIVIDAEPLGDDLLVSPVPLSVGPHTIEVRCDGFQTVREQLELKGGETVQREIALAATVPVPAVASVPTTPAPAFLTVPLAHITTKEQASEATHLLQNPWFWGAVGGVVVAAVVIGLVVGQPGSESCGDRECIELP